MIQYTQNEERANSLTHAAGLVMTAIWGIWLLTQALAKNNIWWAVGMCLFLAGVCACYTASTLYHSWKQGTATRQTLRKCDHACIYLNIAGCYSPLTLAMHDSWWGWGLFIWIWICSIVGQFYSYHGLKEHSYIETACYILMGCSVLVAFGQLWHLFPHTVVYWIIAEGVMVITGATFYSLHKIKYMHTVFHVFCLAGTACHLMALTIALGSC